jgi:hypothetical protein
VEKMLENLKEKARESFPLFFFSFFSDHENAMEVSTIEVNA